MAGQTEKVENENKEETGGETPEETKEVPPPEPEEITMTLEEYRAQKKNVNRNPNAKAAEEAVKVKYRPFYYSFVSVKLNQI